MHRPVKYEPLSDFNKRGTPTRDAVNSNDFGIYPSGIYDKGATIYLPRTQPSGVWNITRQPHEDPVVQNNRDLRPTGGVLPPRFSHFQPLDSYPAPRGMRPGLSYHKCENIPPLPSGMAPARFYNQGPRCFAPESNAALRLMPTLAEV